MKARDLTWALPALLAHVGISSALGLSGRFLVTSPAEGVAFLIEIWSASAAADVVFVVGSALAGVLTYAVARRLNGGFGAVAGVLANWLVYGASFALLPDRLPVSSLQDLATLFSVVGAWGFFGLAFCALGAPLLAHMREQAEEDREDVAALA